MPEPAGGAAVGGFGGAETGPVNVAGGTSIGGGGDGGDAGTMIGSGGIAGALAGGAPGEGGAAGSAGEGGNAGGTSPCTPGVDCLTIQTRLPAPCAGIPYSELLSITGGTGPYTVQLLSAPGGFELRQEGAAWRVVSTGSSGPTTGALLQVEARDSGSPAITRAVEIDLSLRESCWLAYLAEDGPSRLHFRDVFLQTDVVLPSVDVLDGVVDFKFSPDGNWLAFRVGEAPRQRLFTSRVAEPRTSLTAAEITFECPSEGEPPTSAPCGVLDYVWSRDSQHLAVVLSGTTAEQDYLSAVSGFGTEEGPGRSFGVVGEAFTLPFLVPVPLDYHGHLIWIDRTQIGFLGPELSLLTPVAPETLYTTLIAPEASSLAEVYPNPSVISPSGSTLLTVEGGITEIFPATGQGTATIRLHPADGSSTISHEPAWLSPSRRWVARGNDEDRGLALYALGNSRAPVASNSDDVCLGVLAWSRPLPGDRELLACRSEGGTSFFAFHHSEPRLDFIGTIARDLTPGIRRGFASSGGAFVFGEDDGGAHRFWHVDLTVSPPDVTGVISSFDDPPVELELPDGRDTVALSSSELTAEYGLSRSTTGGGSTTQSAPRSTCQESFARPRWCGAPQVFDHLRYSPDDRTLLFQASERTLRIAAPPLADVGLLTNVLVPCAESCLAPTYAFQP